MVKKGKGQRAAPGECFYICAIGSAGSEERKRADRVFKFVVSPAAQGCKLRAERADLIDESGSITSQVIDRLIGADVVVADFWSNNPNVFYELAIRHAVKKPVIHLYTDSIPFDVQPMRAIKLDHTDLESADEAKRQVLAQMKDALRPDFEQWTPFDVAIDLEKLQAGDSDINRTIAGLYSMVEAIKRSIDSSSVSWGIERAANFVISDPSTPEGLKQVRLSNHVLMSGDVLLPDRTDFLRSLKVEPPLVPEDTAEAEQ